MCCITLSVSRCTQTAALLPWCTPEGHTRSTNSSSGALYCGVHAACAGRQPVFSSFTEDTGAGLYRKQCCGSAVAVCLCMHACMHSALFWDHCRSAYTSKQHCSSSDPVLLLTHTYTQHRCAQSELTDWGRNPPDGCCLESCEPITHWTIIMAGPEESAGLPRLYEGEVFRWVFIWGSRGLQQLRRRSGKLCRHGCVLYVRREGEVFR